MRIRSNLIVFTFLIISSVVIISCDSKLLNLFSFDTDEQSLEEKDEWKSIRTSGEGSVISLLKASGGDILLVYIPSGHSGIQELSEVSDQFLDSGFDLITIETARDATTLNLDFLFPRLF